MRNIVLILLGVCIAFMGIQAQAQSFTLSLPDTTAAPGETIDLPIRVVGFDEIVSMQFSLSWDASVIAYQSFQSADLDNVAIGTAQADAGSLRLSWFDIAGLGSSLPDGSTIIVLRFLAVAEEGSSTPVDFSGTPLAIQIFRAGSSPGEFDQVASTLQDGLVTIRATAGISVAESVTPVSCSDADDGSITLDVTYDDEYLISWSGPNFSGTGATIDNLIAGTYFVTISTPGGEILYEADIQVEAPNALAISDLQTQDANCSTGRGSVNPLVTGGTPPYRYDLGDGPGDADLLDSLLPGNYALLISDAKGCTISADFFIGGAELPVVDLGDDRQFCAGESATLSGGDFSAYAWSTGANSATIEVDQSGTYRLTVTDARGCQASDEIAVEVTPLPAVDLGADLQLCPGTTATLAAGDFATYRWSTGATAAEIQVSQAGAYAVTVTNAEGCEASDELIVDIAESLPEPDLGADRSLCPGATTTLSGGTFAGYAWSTGATSAEIQVSQAGTYTLTVTDARGCTASDEIVLQAAEAPAVDLGDDRQLCPGAAATLSAGDFATYRWSTGDNTAGIVVDQPGTYAVTVTNAEGCEAVDAVSVRFTEELPELELGPELLLCPGDTTILSGGEFDQYAWSTGANTPSIVVDQAGTYSLTVTDAQGCRDEDDIVIKFAGEIPLDLGPDQQLCPGTTATLAVGVFSEYEWSNGADSQSIEVGEAGTYAVTVTNAQGCQQSDAVNISVAESIQLLVDNDFLDLCPGDSLELLISGAENYTWTDTSGTLSALDIANPFARPDTTVGYTVIGSNECSSDTVELEVFVYEVSAMAGPDTCISPGTEAQLMAFGGISYRWEDNPFPVSDPTSPMPTVSPDDSTTYVVAITDMQGCVVRDSVTVLVATDPESDILAVNVITPNGDDRNDVLYFRNIEKFGQNSLRIFNRWGNIVYQKVNYQSDEERFDGTYNGKDLPAGTYYYMLSFREGEIRQKLTILR